MGVSIDQMSNDGYFPTQKDHLHLLEGVPKLFALTPTSNQVYKKGASSNFGTDCFAPRLETLRMVF